MQFFLNPAERKASGSSCFFEFQPGKFCGKHWLESSVCLHADRFDELDLWKLFSGVLKEFSYCGPTEVRQDQWACLVKNAGERESWQTVIAELTPWAEACFRTHSCFTICGI